MPPLVPVGTLSPLWTSKHSLRCCRKRINNYKGLIPTEKQLKVVFNSKFKRLKLFLWWKNYRPINKTSLKVRQSAWYRNIKGCCTSIGPRKTIKKSKNRILLIKDSNFMRVARSSNPLKSRACMGINRVGKEYNVILIIVLLWITKSGRLSWRATWQTELKG